MLKRRLYAILLLIIAGLIGYFVYSSQLTGASFPFKLGLDLKGGTHLVYKADISNIAIGQVDDAMVSLRDVIERRVNLFGVSEPIVQVERGSVIGGQGGEQRLIVELPGITDVKEAVAQIGKTPILEFRILIATSTNPSDWQKQPLNKVFASTGLTGQFLSKATLDFDKTTSAPIVVLEFNSQGKDLFAKITKENIGKTLAVFLDGSPISMPTIKESIESGSATISGGFVGQSGRDEAKALVRDLNYGSLPVPIELVSTQTIGATLGQEALDKGIMAGFLGFALVALFLVIWYRLPGLLAVISLCIYIILNFAIFKLIPVTLTAAGIAGFIISIGMAVDANILIFERMKEEIKRGKVLEDAIKEGFARAWLSIRDSNFSSIITAVILFWLAPTALVKGFALVFGLGVITSMFTAITASRTLLLAIKHDNHGRLAKFLFGSGFIKSK